MHLDAAGISIGMCRLDDAVTHARKAIAAARRVDATAVATHALAMLGLAERMSSALYARSAGASVADLVELDARDALSGLDPTRYRVFRDAKEWLPIGVGPVLLAILLAVPLPRLGQQTDATDAQRVAAAGTLDRQYGQSRVGGGSAGFSCGL